MFTNNHVLPRASYRLPQWMKVSHEYTRTCKGAVPLVAEVSSGPQSKVLVGTDTGTRLLNHSFNYDFLTEWLQVSY
jgi:hypothetical protein